MAVRPPPVNCTVGTGCSRRARRRWPRRGERLARAAKRDGAAGVARDLHADPGARGREVPRGSPCSLRDWIRAGGAVRRRRDGARGRDARVAAVHVEPDGRRAGDRTARGAERRLPPRRCPWRWSCGAHGAEGERAAVAPDCRSPGADGGSSSSLGGTDEPLSRARRALRRDAEVRERARRAGESIAAPVVAVPWSFHATSAMLTAPAARGDAFAVPDGSMFSCGPCCRWPRA